MTRLMSCEFAMLEEDGMTLPVARFTIIRDDDELTADIELPNAKTMLIRFLSAVQRWEDAALMEIPARRTDA